VHTQIADSRWTLLAQLDQLRRLQGRWCDAGGVGPVTSPSRIVLQENELTLRAYGEPGNGPALLIVPAPIKRAYIWDLTPETSVVRLFRSSAIDVYLLQWEEPGSDSSRGLYDYAECMIQSCMEAIQKETGHRRVILVGHSLGGTLAAVSAALHPARVQGLALIAAPLRFGPKIGIFGHMAAAMRERKLAAATPALVPGSFLNLVSLRASPTTFGLARWLDLVASLPDPQALRTHLLVERWTLDELPLPRRLFFEIVEWLVRDDRFMLGTLNLGGRYAKPAHINAPVLSVVDASCDIVPPQSILPFLDAISSAERKVLWYERETGVALQHVGMLVGRRARRRLWPEILRWIHST
jgi:polyhydroxyalkanoate synthase